MLNIHTNTNLCPTLRKDTSKIIEQLRSENVRLISVLVKAGECLV